MDWMSGLGFRVLLWPTDGAGGIETPGCDKKALRVGAWRAVEQAENPLTCICS